VLQLPAAAAATYLKILHAYMAEPYAPWAGLAKGSAQYQQLKQQRAEQLWGLIDQVGKTYDTCVL
jgi:hypothetical protein